MFRCYLCHEVSRPRETPLQYVIETREKTYLFRRNANPARNRFAEASPDPGGKGHEIVKVVLTHKVCPVISGNGTGPKEKVNGR